MAELSQILIDLVQNLDIRDGMCPFNLKIAIQELHLTTPLGLQEWISFHEARRTLRVKQIRIGYGQRMQTTVVGVVTCDTVGWQRLDQLAAAGYPFLYLVIVVVRQLRIHCQIQSRSDRFVSQYMVRDIR